MNPLFNSMTNPMNMLLGMLQQQNPQGYQTFLQLRNSGRSPQEITNQLMSNMSETQRQQIELIGKSFMR